MSNIEDTVKINTIKFHPNNKITINICDNTIQIIIGPVIDRIELCWSYYNVTPKLSNDLQQKILCFSKDSMDYYVDPFADIVNTIKQCQQIEAPIYINSSATYVINYNTFRQIFKIDHVEKIKERSIHLSEQDLLNDLDFMKAEIIKCEALMSKYKNCTDHISIKKYNMYHQMIYHEQHKMFQISSNDLFQKYLDQIATIVDKHELIKNDEIKINMDIILNMSAEIFDKPQIMQ